MIILRRSYCLLLAALAVLFPSRKATVGAFAPATAKGLSSSCKSRPQCSDRVDWLIGFHASPGQSLRNQGMKLLASSENIQPSDDSPEDKNKNNNKNNKNIRRPHDNRDQLPFLVQVLTPPEKPYEYQVLQQHLSSISMSTNTSDSAGSGSNKRKGKKGNTKNSSSSDDDEVIGETLGEFRFEKNTNTGDKIEIDNQVYVVQRSKCQYKYAGAIKKFVMVRKILQVKPIQRAMQEDYIMRQWNAPPVPDIE